ncbi:biotin-dependent carboxyltransferase family protein [Pseudogemmobacter humi]|uniref:KipI antagonist n=1 Tax=Pseudogemmobacter humi TaxID=2483812 RepID=A0A3P5XJ99_9RHOB|nr:biotin-dependent carboxyltransferase family protein [Pseudogemmobacter humi]VDC28660.1 KipI antagonist [Pseudogemmobacter humi]
MSLVVERIGPAVTVQDLGRIGQMAFGLSRGGAADRHALIEGAALLGQEPGLAALEMAGFGGEFRALADMRIALTGAPMAARLDGDPLVWNASHQLRAGQRLAIGAVTEGTYGYLHLGGGIATPAFLGSRSAHLAGGIGGPVQVGEILPAGTDPGGPVGMRLPAPDRFQGGAIRILPGVHTELFPAETRRRFEATPFRRTPRGNRQGAELAFEGEPFSGRAQLSVLSEPMVPGDIQMTGKGMPFVLLPECQTTGGYPRIGTILPDDLPLVAQAGPGVGLRFRFISHDEGRAAHKPDAARHAALRREIRPLIRHPADIPDLLSYQLVSGVVTGWEE